MKVTWCVEHKGAWHAVQPKAFGLRICVCELICNGDRVPAKAEHLQERIPTCPECLAKMEKQCGIAKGVTEMRQFGTFVDRDGDELNVGKNEETIVLEANEDGKETTLVFAAATARKIAIALNKAADAAEGK